MKRISAVLLAVILTVLSVIGVSAATVTEDNHKSSFQTYADKYDGLSYVQQPIFGFDSLERISSNFNPTLDTSNFKEGTASLSLKYNRETNIETAFETLNRCFDTFGITDPLKQTVKFWVYINDIDKLYCDHDGVYDKPQKGSGTLWVDFAPNGGSQHKYSLQHTLEGNGWHYVEIAFNTHNVLYSTWKKMDLTKLNFMRIRLKAYSGLEIKFDGLEKFTYSNNNYKEPECPKGGQWVSTCDYDALDGSIVTEWYASSFDLEDKVQGSSSVTITGKNQHVDYRCVWGGVDVPINKRTDWMHFDIYISDLDLVSTDFQARLSQSESGEGMANYSFGFDLINRYANEKKGLVNGWNSIDFPISETKSNIDMKYYKDGIDFRLDHVVFFWAGSSAKETYTIKYDNMYIYPSPKSQNASSDVSRIPPATTLGPQDRQDEEEDSPANLTIIIIVVAAVVLAAVLAVIVLPKISKNKASRVDAEMPENAPKTEESVNVDEQTPSELIPPADASDSPDNQE